MIVRLDKNSQQSARRQLLSDLVYVLCHEALRQMKQQGRTELVPVEVYLSARAFCDMLTALPDAVEGLDDEIDDLEDECEGDNDAVLIAVVATALLQARSKRMVGIDIRRIIMRIYSRFDSHELLWPLIEQMADKEDARWLEGKKTDLLSYELKEIELAGGGSEEIKAFMEKYTTAALALTPDEIRSTLIILSSLNQEYAHLFDSHIAMLCRKLGIKPSEIHNHFEKDSGCQVFNGEVTGQFDKK